VPANFIPSGAVILESCLFSVVANLSGIGSVLFLWKARDMFGYKVFGKVVLNSEEAIFVEPI